MATRRKNRRITAAEALDRPLIPPPVRERHVQRALPRLEVVSPRDGSRCPAWWDAKIRRVIAMCGPISTVVPIYFVHGPDRELRRHTVGWEDAGLDDIEEVGYRVVCEVEQKAVLSL